MAAAKQYAWFNEEDGDGGVIGNRSELELFMAAGEEFPSDDNWLEKIVIYELGPKHRIQIDRVYKLVEAK